MHIPRNTSSTIDSRSLQIIITWLILHFRTWHFPYSYIWNLYFLSEYRTILNFVNGCGKPRFAFANLYRLDTTYLVIRASTTCLWWGLCFLFRVIEHLHSPVTRHFHPSLVQTNRRIKIRFANVSCFVVRHTMHKFHCISSLYFVWLLIFAQIKVFLDTTKKIKPS